MYMSHGPLKDDGWSVVAAFLVDELSGRLLRERERAEPLPVNEQSILSIS